MTRPAFSVLFAAAALLSAPASRAATPVDFGRDVRPILSDKCFHCHGPDEAARKAKLRLDTPEGATRERDGFIAVVPGQSAKSELIQRITSHDPEEQMPPPEAKLAKLTPAEIETLRRWIDEGATYQPHWAFQPLKDVPVPPGPAAVHPIDRFVHAGLRTRQLSLQPEADRPTLLRRLSFDLTGLPPTTAELDAFLADRSPDALPRVVDRLLASPRYGERMAADWLDLARYADSFGFQVDRERDMWPWRDWVIGAFNRNLPWDQFVTWQLAGDLLPGATEEQILATGFNRLHAQESEGGSVEEEYRINYVNDRTTTFGTAFLGLTLECARCHDHKYDPISQQEYYSLSAFFQNIDEAGLYSFFTTSAPTPALPLPDDRQRTALAEADAAVRTAEQKIAALRAQRRAAFEAWVAAGPIAEEAIPDEVARFSFDTRETVPPPPPKPAGTKPATPAGDGNPEPAPGSSRFANALDAGDHATTPVENVSVPGRSGSALRLTGDHAVRTKVGNFSRDEPFTVSLWLQTPDVKERAVVLHRSRAWTDAASRGYELLIEEGRLKWSLIHFWPGDAISIRARAPLPTGTWVHVAVTSDGSGRAAGLAVHVDGERVPVDIIRDHLTRDIRGGGGDTLALGERFRDRGFKDGLVDDLRVFRRALAAPEIRRLHAPDTLAGGSAEDRFNAWLGAHDGPWREAVAALAQARGARTALAGAVREVMVMRELPEPKPAFVLRRGEYDQRGARVTAGTPAVLPPFPAGQPRNRLGLARWLTAPDHPLLARVTANRLWLALFGQGLVRTVDDFGSQGDRAEYPEMLDWLAREFVRQGWDVKALLRTIVLSETYRQRSLAAPATMTDDPDNRWLARGPRHRLPAEMIRDHALAVSGLLVERIGGPPVFTYDLPESFKPAPAGKGDDLHRRSVYTFWRRTGPAPVLEAFDVPKRVVCVARRDTTNTPLHALVLLNGPQFTEAARVLAERLHREAGGDDAALVAEVFRRMTCRPPDAREQAVLARMLAEQRDWYRARPKDAEAYVAIGSRPRDAALPAPEVAALAAVVNTLMNHDGFVVKR